MNTIFDEKTNQKAVKALTLGHFWVDCCTNFMSAILPFIAANIKISLALAGTVISISHLLSSVLQPVFGFIADGIKKRFFIFWGVLLSSIFFPLTGIVTSYWQLLLFMVLGSIGNGFFHPQATGFVNYFSPKDISKNMALFIAMGTIGYSIGPLISSSVAQAFSLKGLPFISIVGVFIAFIILHSIPKFSSISELASRPSGSFKDATKMIFSNKYMRILILISMLKSLVVQSYCVFLPFMWKADGYSVSQIGVAIFSFSFLGGVGTYLSSKLEQKIGTKRVFYIAMMSVMPLTFAFVFCYSRFSLLSFLIFGLVGFVNMLSTSVNMSMSQNIMKSYKSMVSGYIGGFSWGVVGVLFALISIVAQQIGILNILMIVSIVPFAFSYLVKYLPEPEM